MKNILFIAYQFPPFGGSHSTRTVAMANAMASKNKVYVIAPKIGNELPMYDNELIGKLSKDVSIISVDLGIFHTKYYKKYNDNIDCNKTSLNNKRGFKEILKKNIKKYKEKFLIPDPVIDWYPEVMKNIDEIVTKINPDIIISSASPYTCHLIGYKISRKYNLTLVLDYGDPWVYEHSRKRGKLRFYLEKRLESKILDHSKKIYVTTTTTRELYLKKFNIPTDKIDVLTMGFYEDDFKDTTLNTINSDKINIIYGGSLNPIHRNPIPFFKAINKLSNEIKEVLNIEIYCNDNSYKKNLSELNLVDTIKFKPIIEHDKFMKKLKDYNLLLLFGNSSSLQVPGKVFNYIGSLTKIYIINNIKEYADDPTYNIISKAGDNFHSYNEEIEILKEIQKIYSDWKQGKLNKNMKCKATKYTWENIMEKIIYDIDKI
ncbi:glycosyltransferase [Paraclostridium sordellii]|nr:glycosyltransferase [Paeniclostridium sordellii]